MISVERTVAGKPRGMSPGGLYLWAMALTALGALGAGLLQNGLLRDAETLEGGLMAAATLALALQALETCAVPVLAFLLTLDREKGLPRFGSLLAAALVSEIPYDLAYSGRSFDFESQNLFLGLAVAMLCLYFFRQYGKSLPIKIAVTAAGLLWVNLLHIRHGSFLLILTVLLWALREKPLARSFLGPLAGVVCSLLSPFYLASPMGFLLVHFHNGEEEPIAPKRYFVYPAILLAAGLAALLI